MSSTAVLGYATLMDVVNEYTSLDAQGQYIWAAQVLDRKCPLVRVLPMVASNQIMSNIGSRDTYIGSPGARRFNEGIVPTTTHSAPLSEPIAMFEDYSEVDYALWRIQNDPNAWRQSQDRRKVEGMTQKVEYDFYYGSIATYPGEFNGLLTRFNSLTTYPNGDSTWYYNVLSGGGGTSANTTSIWIIEFGDKKVYGIYPKNLPGGLEIEDLGKVTKEAGASGGTSGSLFEVLRTHFTWFVGIEIDDERCVQRYSSIGTMVGGAANFDEEVLIQLKNQLPGLGEDPGTVIFCNRTVKTQMDIRAVSQKTNTYFTQDPATGDVWGRPVTRFQGIPVMVAEKITNTETGLS
ncbi:MAG: major capsid protein [Dehalococcoidia bacterium]|jgi:hypothetical protein